MQFNSRMKKPQPKRTFIPLPVAVGAVLLLVLVLAVIAFSFATPAGSNEIGRAVRLGATTSQQVTAFGNDILYYDGTNLKCAGTNASSKWSFQIGANAGFHAGDARVVAWSANQVTVLDKRGNSSFIDKMNGEVQFARAGSNYVAIFYGTQDKGVISVINGEGQSVDEIAVSDQTILDIGFFTAAQATGSVELMWVLGVDTTGTVISTNLSTYQPGKLATGSTTMGEKIAYKVYYYDGLLRVVDTQKISAYDYKLKQSTDISDVLIYGWYLQDVRTVGKNTYQLLIPSPELDGSLSISNLRIMTGTSDKVLHLPASCMNAYLGANSVYAFSGTTLYACRYGENVVTAYTLPVQITGVLDMLENNTVIVASGAEAYVITLPQ